MKLQQLRYVYEVHRHGNHISNVAEALHTSQPGISKQIQAIEAELGFEIFSRTRNRIVGLTDPGREFIAIAQRVLMDVDNLRNLGEEYTAQDNGTLTIATTNTQARYTLPRVIEKFVKQHPKVRLGLRQGNPTQICELVEAGEADIAIGTETAHPFPNLIMLPCFELPRSVIAPAGHPLLKAKHLTLQDIAAFPIITYDPGFSGRWKVMDAFKRAGIVPNVIFSALDADVSKTYVELGLGVAILSTISFDRTRDRGLRARDASHLFESSTTYITLRPNSYLRRFTFQFIRSFAPDLTPDVVKAALRKPNKGQAPSA